MSSALAHTLHQASAWLSTLGRWFNKPSRTFRLVNRSMAAWRVELVSGGPHRRQHGLLRFHQLDPATGTRTASGRLAALGDAVVLEAGAVYEVEVHPEAGTLLRIFRMVDARGRGGPLRFFLEDEGGLASRHCDGAPAGGAEAQPLRQLEPGVMEITRNCW
jgi:hypothetical protein